MRRGFRICAQAALTLVLSIQAGAGDGVELSYLGNGGFLIAAGETKILVDALFGDGIQGYATVPGELRRQAETATGPFAGVDLLLVTHDHRDHFDPRAVGRHLASNPGARLVSTENACQRLSQELADFAEVADRVTGVWPEEGERSSLALDGITVTVLNLHHGRYRKPPVQNLGMLVEVGGIRVLHMGDAEVDVADIRSYALHDDAIDVVIAPWYYHFADFRSVVDHIGARQVVFMHLPTADAPAQYFGDIGNLDNALAQVHAAFPDAWAPQQAMEKRRLVPAP